MTQTLDVHGRVAPFADTEAKHAPGPSTTTTPESAGRFGTFAITFGIVFALVYTVLERLNWPLFTYIPAVGRLEFWMAKPGSGEGPPMYWYGWLALALPSAFVVSLLATTLPSRWLLRATVFACVLAVVWPTGFSLGVALDGRANFDSDVANMIVWMSAIPGLVAALVVSYFFPIAWAQRLWTKLLMIVPIGALVVLVYSLKSYFLR